MLKFLLKSKDILYQVSSDLSEVSSFYNSFSAANQKDLNFIFARIFVIINPFFPNVPFLYSLKISKNRKVFLKATFELMIPGLPSY